ncbi:MAG: hypothetical protein NC916_01970 [Candidatus Omnitrophica bacterium]|nr:hypothetical protein [Candidatus Omnitrophota bacterium]
MLYLEWEALYAKNRRNSVSNLLFIFFAGSLHAQNIIIKPLQPRADLFEKDNLLQINNPIELENNTLKQMPIGVGPEAIRIEVRKGSNTADRQGFRKIYNKPRVEEEKLLREQWKKAFGIDVWYPYYKAKKIERWVKKKLSIRLFKLKGEPQFARDQLLYVFSVKF